jgi:uncharacterized protein (TIGR03000 family)
MSERHFKQAWFPSFLLAALAVGGMAATAYADDRPTSDAPKVRRPMRITIRVPAGAKVWFDGEPTAQTGTTRAFVSPPLEPGRDYHYEVRAQWPDGAGTVERTRRLSFRAGDTIALDFSGRGFLEVGGYSDPLPSAVPTPARPLVPVFDRSRAPANVAPLSEQSPMRGGPPRQQQPHEPGGRQRLRASPQRPGRPRAPSTTATSCRWRPADRRDP